MYQTLDNTNNKQCRICLDDEGTDFIVPCKCKGTMKFVHRKCLDNWRASGFKEKAFTHCDQCLFEYVIEPYVPDQEEEKRRIKLYRQYVCRDIIIFIIVNLWIIATFSVLSWMFDFNNDIVNQFPDNAFWMYCLIGFGCYLIIIGIYGIIISFQRYSWNDVILCVDCSSEGCLYSVIIVIIVLLIFGIFIGIAQSIHVLKEKAQDHKQKLWKYQEAQMMIVRNFDDYDPEHDVIIV